MGVLSGKVVLVTGGAGGIGKECALLAAREGAKVVVNDLGGSVGGGDAGDAGPAEKTAAEIRAAGGEAIYVVADTSDLNAPQKIFDATMEAYGTVDILFNNAGKLSLKPILDLSLEEFQEVMNVNVTSAFLLTKLCAPIMKAKGEGHIINTSSVAGCAAHWGPVAYCTSKHAMNGLTKAMALELGPEIHVNGIQPGAILTAMLDEAGGEAAMGFMKQRSPLGRVGTGREIATTALFLATSDSSFIDGQLIRVDGGVDI